MSAYRSWDWNYGRSPKSNIQNTFKFPSGIIDVRLNVVQGKIASIHIFGDFFGTHDVSELEQQLTGIQYEQQALFHVLNSIDLQHYFGNLTTEQFMALLLLQDIPQ